MRITSIIIFLFLLVSFARAQEKEGKVTSSADSSPIEGVHIVNTTANVLAISNEEGRFNIVASKGDTLVVSNVNFNTKQFLVNDEGYLQISLNPALIQLDEVRVSNLPETESDFRREIISMDVVEDNTIKIDGLMPTKPKGKIPKNYDPNYTKSLGYAINKPISFIVKKFSKKHKNKLKYYQTVANQANTISNNKKYNPEIVKELTGLNGDALTDFMQHLDFDPAFVQRSSEYEIAARILKEFDYYKSSAQKG